MELEALRGELLEAIEDQGVKFRGSLGDVVGMLKELRETMVEVKRELISIRTEVHDHRALEARVSALEARR
jgi:hypothetical protein